MIIILHNHPSLSKISLADVSYLLGYAALKMIVVVTNLGSINYIVKRSSYDRTAALRLYKDAVDMYDKAESLIVLPICSTDTNKCCTFLIIRNRIKYGKIAFSC